MNIIYEDEVKECADEGIDLEDMAQTLFDREDNYNNADPQSGQTVESKEIIFKRLEDSLELIKTQDDRCSFCGCIHNEDCLITEENSVPYGDTYVNESIVVGYACSECGEKETY